MLPCRARPSIVSAGASPPGSLGSWYRVGSSVGTELAGRGSGWRVVKCDERTAWEGQGVGVDVGWEGRKSQDIGCPILDAGMQLLVVESGPLELRSVRSSR